MEKKHRTTSISTITPEAIHAMPTKRLSDIASTPAGLTSKIGDPISIRGSRTDAPIYYIDGVRVSGFSTEISTLPESGQITAGEWNDLHNWKDWMELLEEENYGIMMDRFDIRPVNRYSVLVVNRDNAVLANEEVQLLDSGMNVLWKSITDNSGRVELWENAFVDNSFDRTALRKEFLLKDGEPEKSHSLLIKPDRQEDQGDQQGKAQSNPKDQLRLQTAKRFQQDGKKWSHD